MVGSVRFVVPSRFRHCLAAIIAIALSVEGHAEASEFIEISVPPRDGRFYSQRDLVAACNHQLGESRPLDHVPAGESELTGIERAALLLAAESGLIQIQIEKDRLPLRIPDPQDDQQRRRLERLFGVALAEFHRRVMAKRRMNVIRGG